MLLTIERDLETERDNLLAIMEKSVGRDLNDQLQELKTDEGTVCIEPLLVETDGTFYANEC